MTKISIKQIEAFVQVADQGSFRRAAEKLNTTQPNISSRIAGLEDQLGFKLMDRDAGSVRLTPMGRTLLAKARDVLRSMDEFMVSAGEDHLFDGVLRLGVTEMIVHTWLGRFLTAFKDRFANIDVDLTVDLSANLSTALFGRVIDLSLQNEPFNRQISGSVDLGEMPMVWVAAPALGYGNKNLTLRELSRHPVLAYSKGTLPHRQLRDHIATARDVNVRLVSSTNLAACLQITRDGIGVACLPEAMVCDDLEKGNLSRLRYSWTPDALRFQARFDADTSPFFVAEAAILAGQIASAQH